MDIVIRNRLVGLKNIDINLEDLYSFLKIKNYDNKEIFNVFKILSDIKGLNIGFIQNELKNYSSKYVESKFLKKLILTSNLFSVNDKYHIFKDARKIEEAIESKIKDLIKVEKVEMNKFILNKVLFAKQNTVKIIYDLECSALDERQDCSSQEAQIKSVKSLLFNFKPI